MSKLPWEPGFVPQLPDTNLIGTITGALEQGVQDATQVATNLGSQVAGQVGGPAAATAVQDVGKLATDAEQAAGQVASVASGGVIAAPTAAPAPAPGVQTVSTPGGGGIGGALVSDLESVALNAAKQTTIGLLPGIERVVQQRVAGVVQKELSDVLTKLEGGAAPATPDLADFTKADARSRAVRTLITGVVLSVVWGLVNVLGNIATVDWTNRNALPQVVALAAGSVAASVAAYAERVLKEPTHVTNATIIPGTGPTS